jgi:uncharacterized protein YdhG (YjbR/CyaY superfamily)
MRRTESTTSTTKRQSSRHRLVDAGCLRSWNAVSDFLGETFPGCQKEAAGGREVVRVAGKVVAYLASNDRSRPSGVPDNEEFVIVRINFDRREHLLELNPEAFFVTPHYKNYPGVIVRLSTVDQRLLRDLLVEAWRLVAPKRLVRGAGPNAAPLSGSQAQHAMAKTDFKSVDKYIAARPEAVQEILGRVRSTIRKAVPGAQEVISYRMPTYTLYGDRLLYFAVWKQHYSIYAATEQVVAAFQDELASYQVDKGTIRFPLSEPVPVKLIGRIAKFRAEEIAGRRKAKTSAPKNR